MRLPRTPHRWNVAPARAVEIQRRLVARVSRGPLGRVPRRIAGVDAAFTKSPERCVAAVVLWDLAREEVIEARVASRPLRFPYVPGLLSFREAPAILAALRSLEIVPDVILCDGQGIAHPRRLGIASHLGVLTAIPSVGCAKSRLIGDAVEPGGRRGARAALIDRGERVGTVLRTRDGVRPMWVSVGHGVSLPEAEEIVLACATHYRLPEPTRLADRHVAGAKRRLLRRLAAGGDA